MKTEPLVSIVIPTRNSEKTLAKGLESIKNQTYKNIEVIVVDRFSNDKTVEISKKYASKVFQINAKERSEQRNFGAKNSKGKYILFIDSDMELTHKVIAACVRKARETNCSGLIIPEKTIGNNFLGKVREFERSFYPGSDLIEASRFFIKENFLKAGMYDQRITGQEDFELPLRIKKMGVVTERINEWILHHEEDISLVSHLKKKYYYALTANIYIKENPEVSYKQFNPFYRYGLFLTNRRFYSRPMLAIGVLTLKTLEYISFGLGFLAGTAGISHGQ